jgi:hypothetical protein
MKEVFYGLPNRHRRKNKENMRFQIITQCGEKRKEKTGQALPTVQGHVPLQNSHHEFINSIFNK